MIVRGKVRGLSNYYPDKVERQEIWINKDGASGLPYVVDQRVEIVLVIDGESYRAGLRATDPNKYVWISPDVYREGQKHRLADVLRCAGHAKNDEVELKVDGLRIAVEQSFA